MQQKVLQLFRQSLLDLKKILFPLLKKLLAWHLQAPWSFVVLHLPLSEIKESINKFGSSNIKQITKTAETIPSSICL